MTDSRTYLWDQEQMVLHTLYQWATSLNERASFNSFLFKRNASNAAIMYINVTSLTVQKHGKQTWN